VSGGPTFITGPMGQFPALIPDLPGFGQQDRATLANLIVEGAHQAVDLLVQSGTQARPLRPACFARPAILQNREAGADDGNDAEERPFEPGLIDAFHGELFSRNAP